MTNRRAERPWTPADVEAYVTVFRLAFGDYPDAARLFYERMKTAPAWAWLYAGYLLREANEIGRIMAAIKDVEDEHG